MFPLPRLERGRDVLVLCLALLGIYQLSGAALIQAKARLAPLLIADAWRQTLRRGGVAVKPWPWADTWPVARLRAPALGVDLMVLAGDAGNALAFGPGHARASAPLGSAGLAVIGGHRDTHFAFLRRLQPDAPLQLQLPDGALRDYRVERAQVVDIRRVPLYRESGGEALMLVTCYPFDALRVGGPLRYVVRARPLPGYPPLPAAGPAPHDAGRPVAI